MSLTKGAEIIRGHMQKMPGRSGVYRMLDEAGKILYIGKAKNLPKRVASYTKPQTLPYRLQVMIAATRAMEFTVTKNEAEALLMEANLIKQHQPKFNILLKDGKSFPYILLTQDKDYNMMLKFRGRHSPKGKYFGPFISAGMVYRTLGQLQKAFPLRTCSDETLKSRTRPCLEYQIKRCSAPCVQKISQEDYKKIEVEVCNFLSGKTTDVQETLSQQMEAAAAAMNYELAGLFRDRIYAMTRLQTENKLKLPPDTNLDAIVFYQEANKLCVEVSFIRNGFNYGNNSYFPTYLESVEEDELAESFIMQFYETNPVPKTIITNMPIHDVALIQDALEIKTGNRVEIEFPKRGDKLELIRESERNAQEALARRMSENATQKKLLKLFCEEFQLPQTPERIEVYDNSHNQGDSAVGAMVVINDQGLDKKSYRKYNIKTAQTNDDFAMMKEVLTRRFVRGKTEDGEMPDVCVIDGGVGQLTAAYKVFEDLGVSTVTLIAMSKGPERNAGNEEYHMIEPLYNSILEEESKSAKRDSVGGDTSKRVNPPPELSGDSGSLSRGELKFKVKSFRLKRGSELAYFMQRIRDEAHRFAITTHRAKRSNNLVKSALDEIEGVGAKRKKALLNFFGSVNAIKQASVKDLRQVEGVNAKTAEIVFDYFH